MSEKPERQRIVEEAIEWMVRLQSGDFSAAEGDALERWKALSSEHAEVFRQLLGSLAPLQDSPWRGQPSATVLRALEQPSSRRRFVGGALGLFVLLAGGAGLERWVQAGMGLPGELATGTGERRDWLLADGSRLRLNARSKARPLLYGAQRRLELRRGAMRLEVKEDPRGAFALDCAAGRVDCASGSLLLAEERGAIRLVTLRGSARLTTGEGRQLAVAARRSLLFDAGGLLEQGPMQAGEDAWASGWLEVHDRSLAWVAEAFRPYLPGILQLDAEIAGNRVSGLFPLDDMHTSLDMLGRSLPIRVLRYSDYWISLRPA
ncbi:TPA: FecR family protein [Pseudomonas aeruginosa]|nr:FecR family protein [Pseudomonas aeruginosa]HCF7399859.1 FecR family protein [Pseudomonas aeruginosa]HCF7418467.1 FecR family protein [Pseudomonas aeruginosa]